MRKKVFISYPSPSKSMAERLTDNLSQKNLSVWFYDRDKALTQVVWEDIQKNIKDSDLICFVVSEHSGYAQGQIREFEYANQTKKTILPLFEVEPNALRDQFSKINGLTINSDNIKYVAYEIERLFADETLTSLQFQWNIPTPGQWLEICRIDPVIHDKFTIGDKFYFRTISPMGFFECYVPKIDGLYWILPKNVRPINDPQLESELDKQVPQTFTILSIYECCTQRQIFPT